MSGAAGQPGDRGTAEALALLERWLGRNGCSLSGRTLLGLVLGLLGSRAVVFDAVQFVFAYGRQQGYGLPAYPLAGCGEIKAFLKDFGVRNIPGFYERIGIGSEEYGRLPERTLVVARNLDNRRKAFLLDVPFGALEDVAGRRAYDEGAHLREALPQALGDGPALDLASALLAHELSEDADDPTLF